MMPRHPYIPGQILSLAEAIGRCDLRQHIKIKGSINPYPIIRYESYQFAQDEI